MKIPFSIIPQNKLRSISKSAMGLAELPKPFFPYLEMDLKQADSGFNAREYISMCVVVTFVYFVLIFFISFLLIYFLLSTNFLFISFLASFIISFFIFMQQMFYPKLIASRRIRDIDRNLLPALRTLLIHINSGVPLFDTMVAISHQNYGGVSNEFKNIVKKVSSGLAAVDAIEDSATNSPSLYYRRALWQISNGMKAGSNISSVLEETLNNLSKEQIIQIEQYGSQLSPLAMFYMIIAVIMPALAMTMLIILSSFVYQEASTIKMVFFGIYVFILFFQIMFLGMIKTRRPNLIGF
ncbi:type II secretion system F family protein [Candidatus Woesearchaeota archaeon]|nr:type II secretion system F family protein [Candidatus Woesearchaeota archaeon]